VEAVPARIEVLVEKLHLCLFAADDEPGEEEQDFDRIV
jgi:hypothetical protein